MNEVAKRNWLADCPRPSMNACVYWLMKYRIKPFYGNGTGTLPDKYLLPFQDTQMECLGQAATCDLIKSTYRVVPFVTYGSMPTWLVKYWVVYQCDFRIAPYSSIQCELVTSKYGNDTSKWWPSVRDGYVSVNKFIQGNYKASCYRFAFLDDPFDTQSNSTSSPTPIVLSPISLNVSVSMVTGSTAAVPKTTDRWSPFLTSNGPVLRCGNGTYISPGVTTSGSILFGWKRAVQLVVSSHWSLGLNDTFNVGYLDTLGLHPLMGSVVAGTTVYGAYGTGQLSTSYVFFPSSNFRLTLTVLTSTDAASRKGVMVDSLSAMGF
jgi:hypothetical protein